MGTKYKMDNFPSLQVKFGTTTYTIVSKKEKLQGVNINKAKWSRALNGFFEKNSSTSNPEKLYICKQVAYAIKKVSTTSEGQTTTTTSIHECIVDEFEINISNFSLSGNNANTTITFLDDDLYVIGADEDTFPFLVGAETPLEGFSHSVVDNSHDQLERNTSTNPSQTIQGIAIDLSKPDNQMLFTAVTLNFEKFKIRINQSTLASVSITM